MKKLLLFLLVSIFSTQSIAALDVYDCEVKINQTVYEDKVYDRFYDVDSFVIKVDKNKITFSEDWKKRPQIAYYPEFTVDIYENEEDILIVYGRDVWQAKIHMSHDKEKNNFAYLTVSSMDGWDGGIVNLIARCTPL